MPDWLLPLAAASLTVLFLNVALCARRARERSKQSTTRFRRGLRRWDGRLPQELERRSTPHGD
jgi:hypothetical protein